MRIINVQDIDSIIESVRPKTNNDVKQKVLSIISMSENEKIKPLKNTKQNSVE